MINKCDSSVAQARGSAVPRIGGSRFVWHQNVRGYEFVKIAPKVGWTTDHDQTLISSEDGHTQKHNTSKPYEWRH